MGARRFNCEERHIAPTGRHKAAGDEQLLNLLPREPPDRLTVFEIPIHYIAIPKISKLPCPPPTIRIPSRNAFGKPLTLLNSSDIIFRSGVPAEIMSGVVLGTRIPDRVCKSILNGKRSNAGSATSAAMYLRLS